MASTTLYRFRIDVSDMDRDVYEALDFRVAQHPSEAPIYLVTRVLAYVLNVQDGLTFSPGGLSDPDSPCLRKDDAGGGGVELWIEIGNPSARKVHKASKASKEVKIYTYKDPALLLKELESEHVHQVARVGIHSFDPRFLEKLVLGLQKDNAWSVTCSDGSLIVTMGKDRVEQSEILTHLAR